jgi:hypothetical protein
MTRATKILTFSGVISSILFALFPILIPSLGLFPQGIPPGIIFGIALVALGLGSTKSKKLIIVLSSTVAFIMGYLIAHVIGTWSMVGGNLGSNSNLFMLGFIPAFLIGAFVGTILLSMGLKMGGVEVPKESKLTKTGSVLGLLGLIYFPGMIIVPLPLPQLILPSLFVLPLFVVWQTVIGNRILKYSTNNAVNPVPVELDITNQVPHVQ